MFVASEDMNKIDIFRGISDFASKFLAQHMKIVSFKADSHVMSKGSSPSICYFILDGICHVRNPESLEEVSNPGVPNEEGTYQEEENVPKKKMSRPSVVERHQGFRGIGDSLGITSALAYYARQGREEDKLLPRKDLLRHKYETFLGVGANTSDTYAITDCKLLQCDRDTLLTAIQICPVLVANIARSLSMRMQQDTLLQRHAAVASNNCLPLLAQFLYEWHMVTDVYKTQRSNQKEEMPHFSNAQLQLWLRISDEKALASALRFLRGEEDAISTMMEVKGISLEAANNCKAIEGNSKQIEVIDEEALLNWWGEPQSAILLKIEQKKQKEKKTVSVPSEIAPNLKNLKKK